jgi:hypothetical protein
MEVHCWSSTNLQEARRRKKCYRQNYYLINGNKVRVDISTSTITEYEAVTDKVYLGMGTWVETDYCSCNDCIDPIRKYLSKKRYL